MSEYFLSKYIPPQYESNNFHCPHCHVYASQCWEPVFFAKDDEDSNFRGAPILISVKIHGEEVLGSICSHCKATALWLKEKMIYPLTHTFPTANSDLNDEVKQIYDEVAAIWLKEKMIYPLTHTFPTANSDLNDEVKQIYDEAAAIAYQSPRAACALLRLALEKLIKQLGETGNLNEGIKNLVAKGLRLQTQQALDILRVTGNNAVHPGVIIFDDTTDVRSLFNYINEIAENLITRPKQSQERYDQLPEQDRKAIEKRDRNAE